MRLYDLFNPALTEDLTDHQIEKVSSWIPPNDQHTQNHAFTDHAFGGDVLTHHTLKIGEIASDDNQQQDEPLVPESVQKFFSDLFDKTKNTDNPIQYQIKDKNLVSRKIKINHPEQGVIEKDVEEKIGKALEKNQAPAAVKQEYANSQQKAGAKKGVMDVWLTRAPSGVCAMSAKGHTGWSSCMTIAQQKGEVSGINARHLKDDIKMGTAVAYLGDPSNPSARIAVKKYVSNNESSPPVLRPDTQIYGLNNKKFHALVKAWCEKHFPLTSGHYTMAKTLYNDSHKTYAAYQQEETDAILEPKLPASARRQILKKYGFLQSAKFDQRHIPVVWKAIQHSDFSNYDRREFLQNPTVTTHEDFFVGQIQQHDKPYTNPYAIAQFFPLTDKIFAALLNLKDITDSIASNDSLSRAQLQVMLQKFGPNTVIPSVTEGTVLKELGVIIQQVDKPEQYLRFMNWSTCDPSEGIPVIHQFINNKEFWAGLTVPRKKDLLHLYSAFAEGDGDNQTSLRIPPAVLDQCALIIGYIPDGIKENLSHASLNHLIMNHPVAAEKTMRSSWRDNYGSNRTAELLSNIEIPPGGIDVLLKNKCIRILHSISSKQMSDDQKKEFAQMTGLAKKKAT